MYRETPKNVRVAMKMLHKHKIMVSVFSNDPMTEAIGCARDFMEDFERRERAIAGYIVNHSPAGTRRHSFAANVLEGHFDRYAP